MGIFYSSVILHYYGNGRRNEGDWCFGTEFITFDDIADLYIQHGRGRTLTIISDCHSSGMWLDQCKRFLYSHGVPVCGHVARERGILLKVYASCERGQNAVDLRYTTKGISFKDGRMDVYTEKKLGPQQNAVGADFTSPSCEKYQKDNEIQLQRVFG